MWAHKLSCEAYQDLLDRGWRRSGLWLYRPLPDKQAACKCHPYTIRLDTAAFQPSKVRPGEYRWCLELSCPLSPESMGCNFSHSSIAEALGSLMRLTGGSW